MQVPLSRRGARGHLPVDNVVGLAFGRKVPDVTWAKVSALYAGKAQ